jgi:hypothetical protein
MEHENDLTGAFLLKVRSWLEADSQPTENDVCSTPTRVIPGEAGKSDIDPDCIGPRTGMGLAQQSTGVGGQDRGEHAYTALS